MIRLSWKPIDIVTKLDILLDAIEQTRNRTPSNKSRLLTKIGRWKEQIEQIREGIEYVNHDLASKLETILGLKITNPELLQVALFQPSTKNLFLELETHYENENESPLGDHGFADLIALGEIAMVMALLGDATIAMGVLYQLWRPEPSDVGYLTKEKSEIVSNENMAALCDRWGLYEHRIHLDSEVPSMVEIEHDKGTLVEAIYGIIQMEYGFDRVLDNIRHLL
jgi:ribonuclease-3